MHSNADQFFVPKIRVHGLARNVFPNFKFLYLKYNFKTSNSMTYKKKKKN